MNVVQSLPVEIAIRTLSEEDRRRVWAWFDHLRNWENDAFVREHSEKLSSSNDVYVLRASDGFRIFFRLAENQIEILDIATRAAIISAGRLGSGQ